MAEGAEPVNVDERKWWVTVDYEIGLPDGGVRGGTVMKTVRAVSSGKAIDKVIDDMGDAYGEILSADAEEVK
jgi:hypothetical protein